MRMFFPNISMELNPLMNQLKYKKKLFYFVDFVVIPTSNNVLVIGLWVIVITTKYSEKSKRVGRL